MVQTKEEFLQDCRFQYENTLSSIFLHFKRGYITESEAQMRRYNNYKWYSLILRYFFPENEVVVGDLSPALKKKYDNIENFPLCSVIFYRDHEIPCYDDDYGQQVFACYEGKTWSGGAYNLCYADEFCRCLDATLDAELWRQLEEDESV